MSLVSIIVPAYNVADFLEECLTGALRQSYKDIEVIVVNDGSTDATRAVAERIGNADSRVRIIDRPNGGLSVARNTGIEAARGEWLVFLDGDDVLHPRAVETLMGLAVSNGADIACSDYTRSLPFNDGGSHYIKVFSPLAAIEDVLYQKTVEPSACGKIFRRNVFEDVTFREGSLYEDLDLFYLLFAKADRIVYTSRQLYFYRINPGSILNTFNRGRLDALTVTGRIEKWARQHEPSLIDAARDRRLSASFNILGLIVANGKADVYPDAVSDCLAIIRRYRRKSLFNRKVRLKNKTGILVSFLGKRILCRVLERHYRPTFTSRSPQSL